MTTEVATPEVEDIDGTEDESPALELFVPEGGDSILNYLNQENPPTVKNKEGVEHPTKVDLIKRGGFKGQPYLTVDVENGNWDDYVKFRGFGIIKEILQGFENTSNIAALRASSLHDKTKKVIGSTGKTDALFLSSINVEKLLENVGLGSCTSITMSKIREEITELNKMIVEASNAASGEDIPDEEALVAFRKITKLSKQVMEKELQIAQIKEARKSNK